MGWKFKRTLKLDISFSLEHFFISVAIFTQVSSAPLSVHLFDLITYETMFPDIYEKFNNELFTFQKSENQFSGMALDHVDE